MYYKRKMRVNELSYLQLGGVMKNVGTVKLSLKDTNAFLWDTAQDFTAVQLPSGVTNKGARKYMAVISEGSDSVMGYCDLITAAEALGADCIVQGAFAADADWTKGADWTIAAGVAAKATGSATALKPAAQLTMANGVIYKLVVSLKTCTTAGVLTITNGTLSVGTITGAVGVAQTAVPFYFVGTGEALDLSFTSDATFAGTIDDVVCKPVTAVASKQGIVLYNAIAGGAATLVGALTTLPANFNVNGTLTYKIIPIF